MRDFIVNHTGRFALGWLGVVVASVGAGALAMGLGVSPRVALYTQAALHLALVFAVAAVVRDRVGGLVAVALTMVLPFGAFIGWAEVALSAVASSALMIAALGVLIMGAALWPSLPSGAQPASRLRGIRV